MKRYLRDVSVEMLGSIIGGLVLAGVFFVCSDFLFKPPDLSGRWLMATITQRSAHAPFVGLVVMFEVTILQDGDRLTGTAETVGEINDGKPLVYDYDKRVHVDLTGAIDRNYLTKDKVLIHWRAHGRLRDSSSVFRILRFDDNYMLGQFDSTIASGHGPTEWVREEERFTLVTTNLVREVFPAPELGGHAASH